LHSVCAFETNQYDSQNEFAFHSFACWVLINFIWPTALPRPQKSPHPAPISCGRNKGAASAPKCAHNSIRLWFMVRNNNLHLHVASGGASQQGVYSTPLYAGVAAATSCASGSCKCPCPDFQHWFMWTGKNIYNLWVYFKSHTAAFLNCAGLKCICLSI